MPKRAATDASHKARKQPTCALHLHHNRLLDPRSVPTTRAVIHIALILPRPTTDMNTDPESSTLLTGAEQGSTQSPQPQPPATIPTKEPLFPPGLGFSPLFRPASCEAIDFRRGAVAGHETELSLLDDSETFMVSPLFHVSTTHRNNRSGLGSVRSEYYDGFGRGANYLYPAGCVLGPTMAPYCGARPELATTGGAARGKNGAAVHVGRPRPVGKEFKVS